MRAEDTLSHDVSVITCESAREKNTCEVNLYTHDAVGTLPLFVTVCQNFFVNASLAVGDSHSFDFIWWFLVIFDQNTMFAASHCLVDVLWEPFVET